MLSEEKYFYKYLKYKQKYLDKQKGGADQNSITYIIYKKNDTIISQLCKTSDSVHDFIGDIIYDYLTSPEYSSIDPANFVLLHFKCDTTNFLYLLKDGINYSLPRAKQTLQPYKTKLDEIYNDIRSELSTKNLICIIKHSDKQPLDYVYVQKNILDTKVDTLMQDILLDFTKQLLGMQDEKNAATFFNKLPSSFNNQLLLLSFKLMELTNIPTVILIKPEYLPLIKDLLTLVNNLKKVYTPTFDSRLLSFSINETYNQSKDSIHFFKFIRFKIILLTLLNYPDDIIKHIEQILLLTDYDMYRKEFILYIKSIDEKLDEKLDFWVVYLKTRITKSILVRGSGYFTAINDKIIMMM